MKLIQLMGDVALHLALCVMFWLSFLGPWILYVGITGRGMVCCSAWTEGHYTHHFIIIAFGIVMSALWYWGVRSIIRKGFGV